MEPKKEKEFRRKLRDCGCSSKQIKEYITIVDLGRIEDEISFLKRRRNEALNELHTASKQIDCIDYYIHKLETKE